MKKGLLLLALGLSGCMNRPDAIIFEQECEYATIPTRHGRIERNRCVEARSVHRHETDDMGVLGAEGGL